jgi:putative chitinase
MTPEDLMIAIPALSDEDADEWGPLLSAAMDRFDIVGPLRESMFIAQVAHETAGLRKLREDLMYSTWALQAVFRKYFASHELSSFAYHPTAIANRVYANRFGNGGELSGDGFRYRGGGCLMTTFRDNYRRVGEAIHQPLEENPMLIEAPEIAALAGAFEWSARGCNEMADAGAFIRIVHAINGGENGIEDRRARLIAASRAYRMDAKEVARMIA